MSFAPKRSNKVRSEKCPLHLVIRWPWTTSVSAISVMSKASTRLLWLVTEYELLPYRAYM